MKPTIGILLDEKTFRKIPSARTGYEDLSLYTKAAKQLGLKPFFMCLANVNQTNALGYVCNAGRYQHVYRSIPKVIHNRAITFSDYGKKKLKKLLQRAIIYNRVNRFGKFHIHQLLSKNKSLRPYLPFTMKYSKHNLQKAMKKYDALFIKPISGSVGDGIIKLKKLDDRSWDIYWDKGDPFAASAKKAIDFIESKVHRNPYIIQEAITLAAYNKRPYDLRVSVQRASDGKWQMSGMVGKVAAKGCHVTNVAKGGKVTRVEKLLQASGFHVEKAKQAVEGLSLDIVRYLGKKLPHLADVGLDIGIDLQGNIKFIELNARDQRITFNKAKLDDIFYQTYKTPLQYAKYLFTNNFKAPYHPKR
jgi:hypothetical protein